MTKKSKPKKQPKAKKTAKKKNTQTKKTKKQSNPKKQARQEARIESKTLTKGSETIRVYGHEVEKNKITNAALDAFNKKRYTTNDIQVHEYIKNPNFHNLMIKIAVLDRIEEELIRLYPEHDIDRINYVTIMVR
ncbi:MAG: hypothetical protein NTU61_01160 [Candidatus Altiarchaeota archaeon]|nr:hypothetical protein [Candidatus Altiarchaeota archaeon]